MFTPHKYDVGATQPWEYLPAAAGEYHVGQLLKLDGGKLAAIDAAATKTPAYLCMSNMTAADGENVPVTRVSHDVIYETTLGAEAADAVIGTMLQVSAGGMTADANAEGSFECTYIEGTETGAVVQGRFH